jgi:hypothetical protein
MNAKSCPSCHQAVPSISGMKFCPYCGKNLGSSGMGNLENQALSVLQEKGLIDAIKYYRKQTGLGLVESKEAMEGLAQRHGVESPKSSKGCVLAVSLVVLVLALALCLFFFNRV